MVDVQVAGLGFQTRAILGGLADMGGKRTLHRFATTRTLLDFRLMLRHFDHNRWNIENLPFRMTHCRERRKIALAVRATDDPMANHLLGVRHHFQGIPLVSGLSARRSPACLP